MRKQFSPAAILVAALGFVLSTISNPDAWAQSPEHANPTLSMGVVFNGPQKKIEERFSEFVRYVAARISPGSNVEGKVVVAPGLPELAKLLGARRVDFYIESPYPTYVVNSVHGVGKLLLRRWKNGVAEYRSLIFTRNDSEIKRVQDLVGKTIVFEDPESTSGYFLPKFFLQRNGFKLVAKTGKEAGSHPGEIGYVFAHSRNHLINSVLTKHVAGGAFSNGDYGQMDERQRSDIRVLAQTELLPRHLLSVRKDFPAALSARLEKVLLTMHENDEGRTILHKTDETTMFDALPGGEAAIRRRLLDSFYSTNRK